MHFLIRKIILDIDYDAANEAWRSHFHKLFGRLCWKENWQKEDENYFQKRRDSCVIEKCELITRKIWYENAWIDNYGWAILLTTNCPSVVNNKLSVLRNYCFPWRFPFWNARQHLLNTKITCLRKGDRAALENWCCSFAANPNCLLPPPANGPPANTNYGVGDVMHRKWKAKQILFCLYFWSRIVTKPRRQIDRRPFFFLFFFCDFCCCFVDVVIVVVWNFSINKI